MHSFTSIDMKDTSIVTLNIVSDTVSRCIRSFISVRTYPINPLLIATPDNRHINLIFIVHITLNSLQRVLVDTLYLPY